MKKIEFRATDGYQYTITEMSEKEKIKAHKIFVTQKGSCGALKCNDCPIPMHNDGPILAGGDDARLSACIAVWVSFYRVIKYSVIKSSIKITY